MSRSDIRVQQQGLDTQQVAMQQLVEQIQQLSKSLSLNTSGSQQRLPPSRYSNRNVQCWNCKEFSHYRRNSPKYKSLNRANPARETPAGCRPRARGMPKWECCWPQKWYWCEQCILSAIVLIHLWNSHMLTKRYEAFTCQAFSEDLVSCSW